VVAAAVTSEVVAGVTASDIPVFAKSERRGEPFGKGRVGHDLSPTVLIRDRRNSGCCVVGVSVRCQLSVKNSKRRDVPIIQ
jgi:hypothetical protein